MFASSRAWLFPATIRITPLIVAKIATMTAIVMRYFAEGDWTAAITVSGGLPEVSRCVQGKLAFRSSESSHADRAVEFDSVNGWRCAVPQMPT